MNKIVNETSNKKINYKIISIIIYSLISLSFITPVFAASKKAVVTDKSSSRLINLASVSAIAVDLKSSKTIIDKNSTLVMPIASITKLMTAMVVLDAKQSLKEKITFNQLDKKNINHYFSRIRMKSTLKRADVIRIALMSSENLAASALGNNYPGGVKAIVKAMNAKAKKLGMNKTHFVDSTGLSDQNVSTARDLAKMVSAAANYSLIKKYTTTAVYTARFKKPRYIQGYSNTNLLVRAGKKNIKLSKTGYLDVAGRCLVLLTNIGGKDTIIVTLDSFGRRSPIGDVKRIGKWITTGKTSKVAKSASDYESNKLKYYLSKSAAIPQIATISSNKVLN